MGRYGILALIACLAAPILLSQQPREPWEWSVAERISERCNRSAAGARVDRARAQRRAPTVTKGGRMEWHPVTDIISGQQSPHLLLPTEVFESVVRNGFLDSGWREAFEEKIVDSGLPLTFWNDLQSIATSYIDDLREKARLSQLPGGAEDHAVLKAQARRVCASRADALAKARALFGPEFDVFLYEHVAPTKTLTIDHVEDCATLISREEGCR